MGRSRLQKTAREILSKEIRGSVHRRFPSQWLDSTLAEILRAATRGDKSAQTAWKLLTDSRFKKP
jgi:hypothetical protein